MSKSWTNTARPNGRNNTLDSGPLLCRAGGFDFCLVIRNDWHLLICKRAIGSTGAWQIVDLTNVIGNKWLINVADSHYCPVMSVDGQGFIHIMGNTHDQSEGAGEGLKYSRSINPYNIATWVNGTTPSTWAATSLGGVIRTTYHNIQRFSDGGLLWCASGNDDTNPATRGRDWLMWYLAPNAAPNGWVGTVGNGELMTATAGVTSIDDIPDRSYMKAHYIDENDVVHAGGVWRVDTEDGNTMREMFYVKSYDRGTTWFNVQDQPVDAPFTYRKTLDGQGPSAAAGIVIDGVPVGMIVGGPIVTDRFGYPHTTTNDPSRSNGLFHVWWDGMEWKNESVVYAGFNDLPMVSRVGKDIWMFGYDNLMNDPDDVGGNAQLGYWRGFNWSQTYPTPPPVPAPMNLGIMGRRTPGGVYTFENSGTFYAAPYWGGGGDGGRHVTRFSFPDGDAPMIRSVGDGPQFIEDTP